MDSEPNPKLRFAPSPNGDMHLGHAYSALLNVQIARGLGAEFIIRMEDIDQMRCTPAYKAAWLEDLVAIGVESDDEILYQSGRQDAYAAALAKLTEFGVLYPCLATRGDIKRHYEKHEKIFDPDGGLVYPNLYKGFSLIDQQTILNGSAAFTLRLNMEAALNIIEKSGQKCSFLSIDLDAENITEVGFNPLVWGDVVLSRKDIATSYHLSVVVDDAMQNITHIIRGIDLYKATYIHTVLQILLNLPRPVYFHHELLLGDDLKKLAKRHKSQAMREILAQNKGLDFISDLLEVENMRNMTKTIVEIMRKKNGKKFKK
ncbi:MAG: tRNA glutamyl-Q(34) synthetase GluQRS [OCS116 cluster bacterium]|uniref:tRNA glutamyl-Q(34) synthetase GluQRS n=1 Tax=OCS116 cluster bacterium TaxID=2030921 RepID=A0A2A4YT20_9PROT|nr:tRNA glutamyl-Q(34) synthetase GluQRS [OCS116 cluster bacterium]